MEKDFFLISVSIFTIIFILYLSNFILPGVKINCNDLKLGLMGGEGWSILFPQRISDHHSKKVTDDHCDSDLDR